MVTTMSINNVNFIHIPQGNINGVNKLNLQEVNNNKQATTFGAFLKDAINDVNNVQIQSDMATAKLAKGENIELHDVMITAQKASITLQAALEVRNKAVEAYQEIMRMQV